MNRGRFNTLLNQMHSQTREAPIFVFENTMTCFNPRSRIMKADSIALFIFLDLIQNLSDVFSCGITTCYFDGYWIRSEKLADSFLISGENVAENIRF